MSQGMWRCYGVGRVTDMSCNVSRNVEVLRCWACDRYVVQCLKECGGVTVLGV